MSDLASRPSSDVPAPRGALAVAQPGPANGHSGGHSVRQGRAEARRPDRAQGAASSALPLPHRLVGLEEAAQVLGISPWSCRDLVWRGELPRVRLPGVRRWLVALADLEALIARSRR